MPEEITTSESSANLFDVEIRVGCRAVELERAGTSPSRGTAPPSPAAIRRRERARRIRRATRIAALVLGVALLVWSTAVLWQPLFLGDVVARVNGQPIAMAQVEREIALSKALNDAAGRKEQDPSPPSMMEQLIQTELRVQAARRANFSVTPQDIDDGLSELIALATTTQDKLEANLRRYGLTMDDLKIHLGNVMLINRFIERYVVNGISDPQTRLRKVDNWQNDLIQTARIERLRNPSTSSAPRVGSQAPDFTLETLDGKEVSLASLWGKRVMINFWAPWCPPCRAEMPVLEKAYGASAGGVAQGDDFELLAVATQSETSNVAAFAQEFNITFPILFDAQNSVTNLYQVGPIPTSFFLDGEGTIKAVQVGQLDAATLAERLDAAK